MDRQYIKDKKRIVIKIGSSSLTHEETGELNLLKIEKLVRQIADLKGKGKEVVLVSSGAVATGRQVLGIKTKPIELKIKQALAAVGQAKLMMVYQKLFSEYNMYAAQILITKNNVDDVQAKTNAHNTFLELLNMGTVPVVNENDTVSTDEIKFGDNDRLSAIVSELISADLLILLSDIDGLYDSDPIKNKNANFISEVYDIDENIIKIAGDSHSDIGTGGMSTKIDAAQIACNNGCDMIIANAKNIEVINEIIDGKNIGTLFVAKNRE